MRKTNCLNKHKRVKLNARSFQLQMKELTTLDILTHSLNCLALFAFTIVDFSRADFSFWFFPSSNPNDNLEKEEKRQSDVSY